ncbi:MAG: FAD-binding oxidoreductase [Alphaproteobacteria bacterium]|nr:FAD-binding oxidoreductase [Alphaproteobacteria bacterium]
MSLNPVNDDLKAALHAELPTACFKPVEPRYLEEPRGQFKGVAGLLLTPKTTVEVSKIVAACNQAHVAIIPYGGGTGLVGGQVAEDLPAPVVLSLERMNTIRGVNKADNVIEVQAGAVLASIQAAADAADRLFPLSLAAQGSCQIGGNLSTNAGGVGVLRYGNTRDLCLGLEAVLPDGTIWNGLKRLRKDNTGYDLKNLLIGAEGSLGVITAATLKVFAKPDRFVAGFVQIRDPEAALELLALCQARLGSMVSAFELIDRQGFGFLKETALPVRLPFENPSRWMVLVELGVSGDFDVEAAFEAVLTDALEAGLVSDALIAQNESQRLAFWAVRESIPEANRLIGSISSHDISVPVSLIPEFIARAGELVLGLGDFRINCFGHVGDGNLHYNIYPPQGRDRKDFAALKGVVTAMVYRLVADLGGSFSAEHGIGRMKINDLQTYGDPAKLQAMRAIKSALDPNGIMNPGVIVPL